eukprot:GAHX01001223.1.p1 GENE.GAHX01001223.1~~GAHX01001223.1.p1  ORF type:complete len:80 (+),score=4.75 GAHX01001223.1:652-891(+)
MLEIISKFLSRCNLKYARYIVFQNTLNIMVSIASYDFCAFINPAEAFKVNAVFPTDSRILVVIIIELYIKRIRRFQYYN